MASNSFGQLFKMTTWGESHGLAVGVVVDGCPAGICLNEDEINLSLSTRSPGRSSYTSPRAETDKGEILSGVFEGKTTGAPISILIRNRDADSTKYESIKSLLRPGHANFTYLEKYGCFDHRGGGRASARETACRVAAGVIARKLIALTGIHLVAYVKQIGQVEMSNQYENMDELRRLTYESPLYCPDPQSTLEMIQCLEKVKKEGDSVGGIVEFVAASLPAGLGDPVYEKLEARLAYAMMGLPASKGFEVGSGFRSVMMNGSEHNDSFVHQDGKVITKTNFAGGILGGISTGMPIIARVAFKPTSSVMRQQDTLTTTGETAVFQIPEGSRHDPCVAIRAVPVVEAMAALVLADALLLNRCIKL